MEDASAEPSAAQEVPWTEVFRRAPVATRPRDRVRLGPPPEGSRDLGEPPRASSSPKGSSQRAGARRSRRLRGRLDSGRRARVGPGRRPARAGRTRPRSSSTRWRGSRSPSPSSTPPFPPSRPRPSAGGSSSSPSASSALLDIVKPGPIDRLQSLPGGWGVMADDLLAGAVAGIARGRGRVRPVVIDTSAPVRSAPAAPARRAARPEDDAGASADRPGSSPRWRTSPPSPGCFAGRGPKRLPAIPLGKGSNVLVPDEGLDAVVFVLAGELVAVSHRAAARPRRRRRLAHGARGRRAERGPLRHGRRSRESRRRSAGRSGSTRGRTGRRSSTSSRR